MGGYAPEAMPRPARRRKKPPERRRRSPDEARAVILDAAKSLLATRGPDAVGLKDVARAAGVSHALVSHYFGTYDGLVDAAIADHLRKQRILGLERIARSAGTPEAWLDVAFEHLAHPLAGRLLVWAMLTGRLEREDFVVFQERGLAHTVDLLEAYLRASGHRPNRDALERATLIGFCAAIGYSLGRNALWGSLGRRASAERDAAFRAQLAETLLSGLAAMR
jgi:AcrR family transcriptional regulator